MESIQKMGDKQPIKVIEQRGFLPDTCVDEYYKAVLDLVIKVQEYRWANKDLNNGFSYLTEPTTKQLKDNLLPNWKEKYFKMPYNILRKKKR